jgi:hypothetical protein
MKLASIGRQGVVSDLRRVLDAVDAKLGKAQSDAVQVWWHPVSKTVFLSCGDWASPEPWLEAISEVPGVQNIDDDRECEMGNGWIKVRDTRRLGDRELSPERQAEIWPLQV